MFDRAVEVLSNAGAELELGRTLAAYADYEQRNGRRQAADELRRQSLLIIARARKGRATKDASKEPPAIRRTAGAVPTTLQ
jgi:hypothetical protein